MSAQIDVVSAMNGMIPVRDAVVELVRADREYDAAWAAYETAIGAKARNDTWDRVIVAEDRRKAALVACGGGA